METLFVRISLLAGGLLAVQAGAIYVTTVLAGVAVIKLG